MVSAKNFEYKDKFFAPDSELYLTVREVIEKNNLLPAGGGIVVGLSGGPDSVCLLHLLTRYLNIKPIIDAGVITKECSCVHKDDALNERLVAVHVNHMLRGAESDRDEEFAKRLCAEYGVRIVISRIDVAGFAASEKISVEAAARKARYGTLEKARSSMEAETGRAWVTAVAHNKDDLAETVLMNILRGAGVDGLRAMSVGLTPDRQANTIGFTPDRREATTHDSSAPNVIRPLLGASRAQIEAYLAANRIKYVTDSTNADTSYMRNRIRNQLLPLLRKDYNPMVVDALRRLSDTAKSDGDYLAAEAVKAYSRCIVGQCDERREVAFSLAKFRGLHAAIAARVIKLACAALDIDTRKIGYAHIDDVMNIAGINAHGAVGKELHLPGGLRVKRTYDELAFRLSCAELLEKRAPPGFVTKSLHIRDNETIEQLRNIRYNSFEQLLDADTLNSDELVLRYRQSGDFFFPIGSPGKKKLKDYFIDAKIPRDMRDTICLLAMGAEIVWIVGYRIGERFKVTDRTVNVLRVRYMPE